MFLEKLVRTYVLSIYMNLSEPCKTNNCATVILLLLLHKSCINWKNIRFACYNLVLFFSIAFLHTVLLKRGMEVPTLPSAAEQTNIRQPHSVQATSLYPSHSVWNRITKMVLSTLWSQVASYKLWYHLFICYYDCFIIVSYMGVQTHCTK